MEQLVKNTDHISWSDELKFFKSAFSAKKCRDSKNIIPVTTAKVLGPRAWSTLSKLQKGPNGANAESMELVLLSCSAVHICEPFLKLKRYDVDKLLLNAIVKFKNPEELIELELWRLKAYIDGREPWTVKVRMFEKFGLAVPDSEHVSIECLQYSSSLDINFITVVLTFFGTLRTSNRVSDAQVASWLEGAQAVDKEIFSRMCKFMIGTRPDSLLQSLFKTRAQLSPYLSLFPSSVRSIDIHDCELTLDKACCAIILDLLISPEQMGVDEASRALISLPKGVVPSTTDFPQWSHRAVCIALESFRKSVKSINIAQAETLNITAKSVMNARNLSNWNIWLVKCLWNFTKDFKSCAELVKFNPTKGGQDGLFFIGASLFKDGCFQDARGLLEASLYKVSDENEESMYCQKLEYLCSCCSKLNDFVSAVNYATLNLEAELSREVLVKVFDAKDSNLAGKWDRWLRNVILLVKSGSEFTESMIPFYRMDRRNCLSLVRRVVVPMTVVLPNSTYKSAIQDVLRKLCGDCLNLDVDELIGQLQISSIDQSCSLDQDTIEFLADPFKLDPKYAQILVWKAYAVHNRHESPVEILKDVMGKSSNLPQLEKEVFHSLLTIYALECIPTEALTSRDFVTDKSNANDLLQCASILLARSKVAHLHQTDSLRALHLALEGFRILESISRSSAIQFSFSQSLRLSGLFLTAFNALALVYGERPYPRECKYYIKQGLANCTEPWKVSFESIQKQLDERLEGPFWSMRVIHDLDSQITAVTQQFNDYMNALSWLGTAFTTPTLLHLGQMTPIDGKLSEIHNQLSELYNKALQLGRNDSVERLIDLFVFLQALNGDIANAIRIIENCKELPLHTFNSQESIDPWFEPDEEDISAQIDLAINEAQKYGALSLSLFKNHQGLVLWIIIHGDKPFVARFPLNTEWDSWMKELDNINADNKTSLVVRQMESAEEKKEWWAVRKSLDQRLAHLAESLRSFFAKIMDVTHTATCSMKQTGKVMGMDFGESPYMSSKASPWLLDAINSTAAACLKGDLRAPKDKSVLMNALIRDLLECEHDDNVFAERRSRLLILNKHLHGIPWEGIFDVPFYRLFTLKQIAFKFKGEKARPERIKYILNPAGDLKDTEKRFAERFARYEGIVGRVPSEAEFTDLLNADLFLYFGHGGGEMYLPMNKVKRLRSVSPSLLIGCSSGRVKVQGAADPEGLPAAYLSAGCPVMVAALWDVTDRDIDAFTEHVLDNIMNSGLYTAAEHVHKARQQCRLKWMNGAAPVVYGWTGKGT